MSDFKFVCREEELNFVQEALLEKKFIIYYYFNDSGLTHYLKKLNSILNTDNEICFYVDCIKSQSIAIQIATQIISCFDKKKLSQYTKSNGEVIKKIIIVYRYYTIRKRWRTCIKFCRCNKRHS